MNGLKITIAVMSALFVLFLVLDGSVSLSIIYSTVISVFLIREQKKREDLEKRLEQLELEKVKKDIFIGSN